MRTAVFAHVNGKIIPYDLLSDSKVSYDVLYKRFLKRKKLNINRNIIVTKNINNVY